MGRRTPESGSSCLHFQLSEITQEETWGVARPESLSVFGEARLMTDHLRRFREYMDVEARYLAAAADRARVLDHKGNRGFDAEHAVSQWLRDRIEPEFTVSSGEVVDSFQTSIDRDSRQHDAIIHENTRFARRFSLQSGLRLVPIEAVALVTEIKLDVDAAKFKEADAAAAETAKLRLAVDKVQPWAGAGGPIKNHYTAGPDDGLPTTASELEGRLLFALFAFSGPKKPETLAEWLREASTIRVICCLDTGCAYRPHNLDKTSFGGCSLLSTPERSLTYFGGIVGGAISQFQASAAVWCCRSGAYSDHRPLHFWDNTGYKPPNGYNPYPEEIAELKALGHLPQDWKPTAT